MALIGTDYTDSHSDEEDSFLNESLKIIKDLEAGEEVTHRVDELIIPQNASNGVITFVYNALKEISYSQSRENNEYHNLSRRERSCIPRLQLNDPRSLSSTDDLPLYSQRATFRAHKRIQTPEYDVLSVDDRSQSLINDFVFSYLAA
uniref:Movement protein n=1 Tax=Heterorhabditis bacteriophora TaxID=37862 RepID=A0A1I7WFX3_HETBA